MAAAKELADRALALAEEAQGSLFLTTSRRTPENVVAALKGVLAGKAEMHCFAPDQTDNPYLGLLAWADRFIVTGDSVSMMVEVAGLGKPLSIFELPLRPGLGARTHKLAMSLLYAKGAPFRVLANFLQECGFLPYPRDLTAIHRQLYECGAASPLEGGFRSDSAMIENDAEVVAERIRCLLQLKSPADEG